ncbi:Putative glycoprotein-receptor [Pantoea agglomerans 299R]|nr:Putative glycoprotein-receptor [Pantoea agglomerans 299R]
MEQAQRRPWGWGLAALLVAGSASAASWQDHQLSSTASQLSTGTTQQNSGISLSSITSRQPGLNQRGPLG